VLYGLWVGVGRGVISSVNICFSFRGSYCRGSVSNVIRQVIYGWWSGVFCVLSVFYF
jgi:hypothetical protein